MDVYLPITEFNTVVIELNEFFISKELFGWVFRIGFGLTSEVTGIEHACRYTSKNIVAYQPMFEDSKHQRNQ